jgi:hypothetical protein
MSAETDESAAEDSDGVVGVDTLRGDIRDLILKELERLPVVWSDLPDLEKNITRDRVNAMASDIVYRAIEIVHSEGAPSLACIVGKVAFGKGVSVALTASRRDPNRHLLADLADGADVLLVLQDASRFMGEREDGDEPDRASEGAADPGLDPGEANSAEGLEGQPS